MLVKADNQPINARAAGDANWITDYITPRNPDVMLKYQLLSKGLYRSEDIITAIWRYVASFPYKETISSKLITGGKTFIQKDTWFYPAETLKIQTSNCANRAFLLASLLKNHLTEPGDVYVVVGNITIDGIGAHAWVQVRVNDRPYFLEATQLNLPNAFIPTSQSAYNPIVYLDENSVYTVSTTIDIAEVLSARFGVCAIPFLRNYLCDKCLSL